jgi:hypothetical protein
VYLPHREVRGNKRTCSKRERGKRVSKDKSGTVKVNERQTIPYCIHIALHRLGQTDILTVLLCSIVNHKLMSLDSA